MNNPLLSICIPTYNRALCLDRTIQSIVDQERFQDTNDVEIVISDNCSEDNSHEVCEKFISIFGDKIHYYRNSENIKDKNYEKVLSYGKGLFLKLNNDTLIHKYNTLDKIIETINQNKENKEIIFFSNGSLKNITKFLCKDLNSFVKTVSFYSTWIACFGIWKDDFKSLNSFSRYDKLQLIQTDVLFRLISSNRNVIVDNTILFNPIKLNSKGGYNFYQVFVVNYLKLFEEYRINNKITWLTFNIEKTNLMLKFLIPWTTIFLTTGNKYTFTYENGISLIFKKFKFHPALYLGIFYLIMRILYANLRKITDSIK